MKTKPILKSSDQSAEPILRPLEKNKWGQYMATISNTVLIYHGQPVIVNNFPPLEVLGETVTNDWQVLNPLDQAISSPPVFPSQLFKNPPNFPPPPEERTPRELTQFFGFSPHASELVPFKLGQCADDVSNGNLLSEKERRTRIAKILAGIVIRIQQREQG